MKEKGFDGFCHRYYEHDIANDPDDTDGLCFMFASDFEQNEYYVTNETFTEYNKEHMLNELIAAPTQQMAMRWLREEHNLFICIGNDDLNYNWQVFDVKNRTKDLDPTCLTESYAGYGSYEKTVEAAIKYCLENLV